MSYRVGKSILSSYQRTCHYGSAFKTFCLIEMTFKPVKLSLPVEAVSVAVCRALPKGPKVRVVSRQTHVKNWQHLHV